MKFNKYGSGDKRRGIEKRLIEGSVISVYVLNSSFVLGFLESGAKVGELAVETEETEEVLFPAWYDRER